MDTKALRQKILDLAIRGKLVPQDPNDEPASVLLVRIREEKKQMVKEGKLKPKDIKNDTIIFKGEDNLHYEKFQDGTVKCIEDEIPFEIPNNWAWCRIRDICNMSAGKAKSANQINDEPFENSYPCFGGNGIRGYVDEYSNDGTYSIIGRQGALCGNVNIASGKFYATEHAVVTYLYSNIDFNWSNYCLEGLNLNQFATGAAQPGLSVANVLNVLLPMPPYEEQRRIGEKVNATIDVSQYLGDKIDELSEIISITKAKILDLAIRGKLVPQDLNDEPASVLLERIRNEKEELIKQGKLKRDKKESIIYKGDDNSYYELTGKKQELIDDILPFEIPNSWTWCRLGSICTEILYGLSNSAETQGTYRLLRITDIQNGKVNWNTVPYTTTDDCDKYLLKENDIVFARTGATVGKSFLIKDIPVESVYASYLIRIRLLPGIDADYIYDFFNSPFYWRQITDKAVGVGQPNCNGTLLQELLIPIPPRSEQLSIHKKVLRYNNEILNIEANLE